MAELSLKAQDLEQQKAEYLLSKQKPPFFTRQINPAEVRMRVDPSGTLPEITLREQPSPKNRGTLVSVTRDILYKGEKIGSVTVTTNERQKVSYINQVVVDEGYRGHGFGLSTYVSVIEEVLSKGFIFRTHDWSQSKEAKKIWDRLVDANLAQIKEKFSEDEDSKYHGVLEIIPATGII